MEVKSDFYSEEAMQKKQPDTVLIDGYELLTYQKYWKDQIKTDAKIRTLRIVSVLQGLAILILAVALLWK